MVAFTGGQMYRVGQVGEQKTGITADFEVNSQRGGTTLNMSDSQPISSSAAMSVQSGLATGTMARAAGSVGSASVRAAAEGGPRHATLVRITHWLIALSFFALLVTGLEILLSHPRFYWGETGNVNMRPLFKLPVPSSRDMVPTGFGYVIPDQNGWSRYLHFEAAWVAVMTGFAYLLFGLFQGHFRRNLFPAVSDLAPRRLAGTIVNHLRFRRPSPEEARSYNVVQRLTYLVVVFVLFPLIIWTGLVLSPTVEGAFPGAVAVLGGRQSARTLHFFITILLVLFVLVHVVMVYRAGFRKRVGAMITGRVPKSEERA